MLLGVLHHISDTGEAYSIVGRLVAALAPGSFVAINHSTSAVHGVPGGSLQRQRRGVADDRLAGGPPGDLFALARSAARAGAARGLPGCGG